MLLHVAEAKLLHNALLTPVPAYNREKELIQGPKPCHAVGLKSCSSRSAVHFQQTQPKCLPALQVPDWLQKDNRLTNSTEHATSGQVHGMPVVHGMPQQKKVMHCICVSALPQRIQRSCATYHHAANMRSAQRQHDLQSQAVLLRL